MQPQGIYFGNYQGPVSGMSMNGVPYIGMAFLVTHKAVGQQWAPLEKPFDTDVRFYLSDKAWSISEQHLSNPVVGFNGSFSNPEFTGDLVRNGTELVCSHFTSDKNKTMERWRIRVLEESQRGDDAPLDTNTARRLEARFKQKFGGTRPPVQPVAPPPPPTAGDDVAPPDDDIPF